jgi:hypothetical protein
VVKIATFAKRQNVSSKAMKTTNIILIFISALTFFACNNSQTENKLPAVDSLSLDKKVVSEDIKETITTDTLYKLLENSLRLDTFEFNNFEPFLFLKTGNLLSQTEKSAILINCPTDSTYKIELYKLQSDKWIKYDEIDRLEAFPVQFFLNFQDYNFDEHTDIYLQCSASQGYSLSRGHLLTFNPKTNRFDQHPETRDLANMQPNAKTKTVISEKAVYGDKGFQGACDWTNKWINGKLKTIKKKCPSKDPKGL